MPNMTSYDRGDVILAILPFSDLSGIKKRPVSSCRHSRRAPSVIPAVPSPVIPAVPLLSFPQSLSCHSRSFKRESSFFKPPQNQGTIVVNEFVNTSRRPKH